MMHMKNSLIVKLTLALTGIYWSIGSMAQNIGIGTTNPHASAKLEVSSDSSGLLIPRMTTAQRDAIAAPAKGLLIFNLDDNGIDRYDGVRWQKENALRTVDSIIAPGHPTPNSWVRRANAGPTNRTEAVEFTIGGRGYMGTGRIGLLNPLNDFWTYDPLTNIWTQLANVGGLPRNAAVGFAIGNKGYIGTGNNINSGDILTDFWEYNPDTNTWERKADIIGSARTAAVGFALGGKGYIGLGSFGNTLLSDLWQYDPNTNLWSTKNSFPGGARTGSVVFTIGDTAYIGLGVNSTFAMENTIFPYNAATGVWGVAIATQAGLTGGGWSSFSLGGRGYVGMGNGSNLFFAYNPVLNTWSEKAAFPGLGRRNGIAFALGNKGYVGTGNSANGSPNNDFWSYMDDNKQPLSSTLPIDAAGAITDGAWTLDAGTVYKSTPGNVGIGTNSPTAQLDVMGTLKTTALQLPTGAVAGHLLRSDAAGNATWVAPAVETDPKAGTLSTNTVPKWGSTSLVNSLITDNGNNLGIAVSSPTARLDVNGTVKATGLQITTNPGQGRLLQSDAQGNASWVTNPSITELDPKVGANTTNFLSKWNGSQLVTAAVREDNGNVGIGVTAPANSRLQINSANNGTGSQNWLSANLGTSEPNAHRLVMGVLNGVPTLGGHNAALNGWTNVLINPGAAGNVGIGLTNPFSKLHVNGSIRLGGQGTPFDVIRSLSINMETFNGFPGRSLVTSKVTWDMDISRNATIIVNPKAELTEGIIIINAYLSDENDKDIFVVYQNVKFNNVNLEAHSLKITVVNFTE
jgi:N-acetylneuraminic acid mutarotase